jgi:hypothetical protein
MTDTPTVETLLSLWQWYHSQGRPVSAEQLCGACPELLDALREQIALLTLPAPAYRAEQTAVLAAKADPWAETQVYVPTTKPDAGPALPPQVPGYEILGELGRGGMGVVYRARHLALDRVVALKMLRDDAWAGSDGVERFHGEARAVAQLRHPHIVQVHEVGTHDGRPYFSLELCEGGSLHTRLAGVPLPAQEAARLVEKLARAVQAAHEQQIIHRDLKPLNVLLTRDGEPKITDFGLAKKLDADQTQTRTGAVLGTPSYMAPEQAGGGKAGPPADVYSLGAILYECLTGRPPFQAPTPLDTLLLVTTAEPVPVRRLQPQVPRDLETICLKCLEKEPARRYASAGALADDLRRFQAGEPIAARPASRWERTRKWARRRPAQAALVLATVLLVVSLTAGILMTSAALEQARDAERAEAGQRQAAEAAERQAQADKAAAVKAAAAERRAKLDAEKAAEAERLAKETAQKRLGQIEKAYDVLASLFQDLNPRLEERGGPPLLVQLGQRLDKAAKDLDADAVGDPVVVARLQRTVGGSLLNLGYPHKAIDLLAKSRQTLERQSGPNDPETLQAMNDLAGAYHAAGQLDLAVALHEETLARLNKVRGSDHPETLTSMNNLALTYYHAGLAEKALALFEPLLAKMRINPGLDHPNTLNTMVSLAVAYQASGASGKALPLFEEALPRLREVLGPDHPDTLSSTTNLAAAYTDAGQVGKALLLLQPTFEKQTAKLGLDHPETLATMHNLAEAYLAAGQLRKALPLLEQALPLFREKFGPDQAQTLSVLTGLAMAYHRTGRLATALQLYEEVLAKCKARLGADHPQTLRSMNNLAEGYRDAGKFNLALALSEDAVVRTSAKLGPDHPDTLGARNTLALLYLYAGKLDVVIPYIEETLQKQKARLGPEHPSTLTSTFNLACAYRAAGKLDRALPLFEVAAAKRKAVLGDLHRETLISMSNLGGLYRLQGKLNLALPLLKETLEKFQATLGPDHTDTLQCVVNLALAYQRAGKLDLAVPLLEGVLDKTRPQAGPNHPNTVTAMHNLGVAYYAAGKLDKALPLLAEVLARREALNGPKDPRTLQSKEDLRHVLTVAADKALAHINSQRYAEAEPLLEAWLAVQRPRLPADDPQWVFNLKQLGESRLMQKKYANAEEPLREGLAVLLEKQPSSVARFETASLLGAALAGQKKYAEAEPLLLDAARAALANADQLTPDTRKVAVAAVQRLIDLYAAWDRPDDAARWRKELERFK